jgi:hypothetical protein
MNTPATMTAEQLSELCEAVRDRERLLDYRELAERLAVTVDTARMMVAARIITPAIRRGNVVRFHWPTVVWQLTKRVVEAKR